MCVRVCEREKYIKHNNCGRGPPQQTNLPSNNSTMCVRFEPVNDNFFNMHDDRIISCCGTTVDGEEHNGLLQTKYIEIVRQYL